MNIEAFRNYCLHKKGVTESFPFDESTLVFKVMDKMFALTGLNKIPFSVNLKCDPDRAITLRESYSEIIPGYHMNKKHWNTVEFSDSLPDTLLKELIDHSYELVVASLPKKTQALLATLD
ncbi:MmcQ/YjbR family DNA-binding protein [Aquimarina intermedia]|uniref:Putative DNA-binding protein (MmcQ/YjbR family) n=1 Tax=Aquimarina intermedia TaxID=350814 RepID=A0A5S5CCX8_9FLAO|nr:MmcQ/YjbR family DNA-binding protein [Aquimarina intermedia]TYP77214.1 putative DNA-binding protein (MmcQ/YjbR family) [Aquimarina intermedia]